MTTDRQLWKFPLPDNWTPDGVWCVQLTIPADQQYMDIFTGVVGALTEGKPFQPDVTGTGPGIVAKTWEAALYRQPFAVSQSCFVPENIPITTPEQGADTAAGIFTSFLMPLVAEMNACAPTVGDCEGCVDTIMGELAPYGANDAVRGALMRLCRDLNADPTHRPDYEHKCIYLEHFNNLADNINNNPYDWLNQLSDFMFNWLQETSDAIMNDLDTLAGLLGMGSVGFAQDHGGFPSGGGASFGTDCPWVIISTPGTGLELWTVATFPGWYPLGNYTGTRWEAETAPPPNGDNETISILSPTIPIGRAVTDIRVRGSGTSSTTNQPDFALDPTGANGYPNDERGTSDGPFDVSVHVSPTDSRHVGVYCNTLLATASTYIDYIEIRGIYL
jgi:hypothetical protein